MPCAPQKQTDTLHRTCWSARPQLRPERAEAADRSTVAARAHSTQLTVHQSILSSITSEIPQANRISLGRNIFKPSENHQFPSRSGAIQTSTGPPDEGKRDSALDSVAWHGGRKKTLLPSLTIGALDQFLAACGVFDQ